MHVALPHAIRMLQTDGIKRDSRNGSVLVYPTAVATVYSHPSEKVVFWPQRDYNVAFALYEALWMLAGRNDLAPLQRYVKTFDAFSDDGKTLHGAYGYRWRQAFGFDQLRVIINRLRANPDDRRCVLQMWDAPRDLGGAGKDVPCNDVATFQRGANGELNMVVFCRSNDVLWGAYYANAFHFAILLEYMALGIGCAVGTYTQVSVNWHGYEATIRSVWELPRLALDGNLYAVPKRVDNPYEDERVKPIVLGGDFDFSKAEGHDVTLRRCDKLIADLIAAADNGFVADAPPLYDFFKNAYVVLRAHHYWRTLDAPRRFDVSLGYLEYGDPKCDWIVSMRQWLMKRQAAWESKT